MQGISSGIRTIKEMFKLLKTEEQKRLDGLIEEEDESSGDERGDSTDKDSGSDSDPMEGELTGAE